MLWLLALIVLVVGRVSGFFCGIFAYAYTRPLTNPMEMALTLPNVTGASKNIKPATAIGSLLRAPTIEYVVEEVTRTHQAEVYEMKTDDKPEKTMEAMMLLRLAAGKFLFRFALDQSSTKREQMRRIGIERRLL